MSKINSPPHISPFAAISLLGFILIIYTGLSFYQINLPGLHYDEAFEAVPAMQLLAGQPVTAFRDSVLVVGPFSLPLMTQDYIGALNTYTALPFIALLGSTTVALRTMSIITGAVSLILVYGLGGRLTGQRWAGLVAGLLLAVDPTFIFWNRQGVFVTAVTATLGLAATYCWLRRFEQGLFRWSITGAFLFGVGIYAKFLFVWLIAALLGAILLLNMNWLIRRHQVLIKNVRQLSMIELFITPLAFLLGCSPLIIYNLQTGGTFLNITQNATTSYYGVNNLAFITNLAERLSQFITLLSGTHLWYLGNISLNIWPVVVLGLFFGGIIYLAIRIPPPYPTASHFPPSKIVLFPFLVIGLIILASIGTVSALWVTHFAILMPWPALAMAVSAWFILSSRNFPLQRALVWAGLGLLIISNLSNTVRYHRALTDSGGLSSHSDAVYDLSNWLSLHAQGPVMAMDWGLAAPVTYLTHGQVTATEIFGYEWQSDVQLTERLIWSTGQPQTLYLWRSPDEIIFDRSDQFKAIYRPQNLEENIEEAFYERSGRPILGVTRLVEKGTATNPPQ